MNKVRNIHLSIIDDLCLLRHVNGTRLKYVHTLIAVFYHRHPLQIKFCVHS